MVAWSDRTADRHINIYVDRAAASRRRLQLFKRWYYFTRSNTPPCSPDMRLAFYAAFVAAKNRHHYLTIARGFDPHHAEWLASKEKTEVDVWSDDGYDSVDESRFKLKTFSPMATTACAIDFVLRKFGEPVDEELVGDSGASDGVPDDGFDSVYTDSPFDEDGNFVLPAHDSSEVDEFIQEHCPNPSRLMAWNGTTLLQHQRNVTNLLERLNPHFNVLRFANANIPRSELRVVDDDFDVKRDERYYQTPVVFDSGASFGLTPFYEDCHKQCLLGHQTNADRYNNGLIQIIMIVLIGRMENRTKTSSASSLQRATNNQTVSE
jgi:hypothetical protein